MYFPSIFKLKFCKWFLFYYSAGWKLLHWLKVLLLAVWNKKQLLKCHSNKADFCWVKQHGNDLSVSLSTYLTCIPMSQMYLTNVRSFCHGRNSVTILPIIFLFIAYSPGSVSQFRRETNFRNQLYTIWFDGS